MCGDEDCYLSIIECGEQYLHDYCIGCYFIIDCIKVLQKRFGELERQVKTLERQVKTLEEEKESLESDLCEVNEG